HILTTDYHHFQVRRLYPDPTPETRSHSRRPVYDKAGPYRTAKFPTTGCRRFQARKSYFDPTPEMVYARLCSHLPEKICYSRFRRLERGKNPVRVLHMVAEEQHRTGPSLATDCHHFHGRKFVD